MPPPLPDLPITAALPELLAVLAARSNAVLIAPPGAGKTTLVPLALRQAPWCRGQRIIMLEPRRLATRAAATRMASLLGERVGESVGYRTRLDSAVSAVTTIEVITEGLLVRRLAGGAGHADPGLDGVAAVILDELHERSLAADLALALCLDLQRGLRPELRLLAMSATADGARLAGLMDAAVVESAGRAHPVAIRHAARDLAGPRDLPDAAAAAIRAALGEHDGDILAFLPGMGEIRRTEAALAGSGAAVLPLHGDLPPAEQDRALQPGGTRRVVLATSIAETSLTVPGVRIVVDGGWRRAPRLDPATGLTRLATVRISRAAADQRAGRAGREAPGVAIRLWTQALHRGLAPFDRPEILEAELSSLALDCAAWGAAPAALPFADPPPAGPLAAAGALLAELGALDAEGRITEAGRRMAGLGAHPRLAAMMLAATTPAAAALAADLAALLEERDPLPNAGADVRLRLAALAERSRGEATDGTADHTAMGHTAMGHTAMGRTAMGRIAPDRAALARIRQAARQYRGRLGLGGGTIAAGDPGPLVAAGFPDRIAQRRGEPGSFRLAGGGGARLAPADRLAGAPLLAVAGLEMKAGARITLAAPLDAAALPPAIAARIVETTEAGFDPASGTVLARRRRRLGTLVLDDRTLPADPAASAAALATALASRLDTLAWSDAARQLQARVARMRELEPGLWPDFSDAALAAGVQDWLAPHLLGLTRLAEAAKLDVAAMLRARLDGRQAAALERLLPTHLTLPGGRAAIDYSEAVPLAAARAQAFYGLAETPALAGGRVKLRLALLSPAGRPIAITADLGGFWSGGWAETRREMRGRYPRHDWPERPDRAG